MPWSLGAAVVGGLFTKSAANKATAAQQAADAARLEEEKRVRELLRTDTEAQRKVADDAFSQYQAGLISYADAQRIAGEAMQGVQQTIADSQLSDVSKATAMAEFKPYAVTTGAGKSFYDTATGQAGFQLSPEQQAYQQGMFGKAREELGSISSQLTPEQQAFQQSMMSGAQRMAGALPFEGTPEQQAYQQSMYGRAAEQAAALNLDPTAQAQKYYQQQQDILAGSRGAEDIAARQASLASGRIGLGVSQAAAGFGQGGALVNPEEAARQLAREQVNKQIAAEASQRAEGDITQQLSRTQGLFGAGAGAQNQIQQALAGQAQTAQGLYGAGSGIPLQQQQLMSQQLQNVQGMYGASMAPETFGLDVMKTGFNLGQGAAQAGAAQAGLYGAGMTDYYKSLLGAAQTGQQAGLFTPAAQQAGAQEAYQRQQTYLQGLQGSNLPYQAMTTPSPMIPGSAYAGAALGGSLASMGSGLFSNYLKQQMQPSPYTMSWENAQNARVASAYPMP